MTSKLLSILATFLIVASLLNVSPSHSVASSPTKLDNLAPLNCRNPENRPVTDPAVTNAVLSTYFPAVVNTLNTSGNYPPGEPNNYAYRLNSPFLRNGEKERYREMPFIVTNAIAMVESEWVQYNSNNQTQLGSRSCDWGIMQINEEANNPLFDLEPSLMTDTRGNIAAGAQKLAELWNNNDLPIINDEDPQRWLNWYYAIVNYNAGRAANAWTNNPNCGTAINVGCDGEDYSASRLGSTTWAGSLSTSFPYQERVLYTLQYPRLTNAPLLNPPYWDTNDFGLLPVTDRYNYGIRPDDSVFINEGAHSTPNLLLFRHRYVSHEARRLVVEYDLPLSANVRIAIYGLSNGFISDIPVHTVNLGQRRAGWRAEAISTTADIPTPFVYEITAERGTRDDVRTYYLGRYRQRVTNTPIQDAPYSVNLPITNPGSTGQTDTRNLLKNESFTQVSTFDTNTPRYWELQAVNASYQQPLSDVYSFDRQWQTTPSAKGRVFFQSGSLGRVEITQRLTLPNSATQSCYELRAIIDSVLPSTLDDTVSLTPRVRFISEPPSADGDGWISLPDISPSDGTGSVAKKFIVASNQRAAIVSFLMTSSQAGASFGIRDVSFKSIALNQCPSENVSGSHGAASSSGSSGSGVLNSDPYPPPFPTRTPRPDSTPLPTLTPSLTPTNTPTSTSTSNPYPAPATATNTSAPYPPPSTATATPAGGGSSLFADSFETGDLSRWSASATDGGDLSVTNAAALAGSFGLQALLDDNTNLFVTDETPSAEASYRASFRFDPNSIAMTNGDAFDLLVLINGTGSTNIARVLLRRNNGEYQLYFLVFNNSGSMSSSANLPITDAPQLVQFDWRDNSTSTGSAALSVNGGTPVTITGGAVGTRKLDRVRFGAVQSVDSGTRGTFFLDDFQSSR
jgi:hypothetical protein